MTDIASIHDKFLRAILSDKEIAVSYFRHCLPRHIAGLLDLSTLTQLPDSYISKELRETISDIVYTCRAKGSSKELKISLLLEHKSKPEKFTPVQLGSYLFSGHLKQIAQDRKLSPIIPILLYHGRERWRYRTLVTLYKNLDDELRPFIPEYDYIYQDLGEIPDEDIQLLDNKFLQASLLALKYSHLKEQLLKWIPTILALAMDTQKNLRSNLIVYTFGVSSLREDRIIRIMEDVPVNTKNTVMNTLDIFVEKGKRENTEKIVRNLVRLSGLSDEQIASAAEVTVDYVARIRESIKSETAPNQ